MTYSVPEGPAVTDELPLRGRHVIADDAVIPARDEMLDVLFRRHYPSLLGVAVVMLGSQEAAEDAVQDAFVALHRNWRTMRDPAAVEAYLRSAVLNRCRSWVRRQVTQRSSRPLVLLGTHHESAEATTLKHEDSGALVALMRTLPRRQREVLACRFALELSVGETARLLGISEGSVKTHTHRGLQALQQRYEVAR